MTTSLRCSRPTSATGYTACSGPPRICESAPAPSLAWLSDEPHAHIFVFTGAAEYVYAQILLVPNENAEDPWTGAERRWAGRIPVDALVAGAARMGQAMLDQYGETGYQKAWRNMPFPAANSRRTSGAW
jgi:hypothetical protein